MNYQRGHFCFGLTETLTDPVTELLITGARQLIKQAIEVELQEFMSQYSAKQTEDGKAIVVRNGYLPERELQTGLSPVTVKIPKVWSKTGEPVTLITPPASATSIAIKQQRTMGWYLGHCIGELTVRVINIGGLQIGGGDNTRAPKIDGQSQGRRSRSPPAGR